MKNILFTLLGLLIFTQSSKAQHTRFVNSGTIEFTKTSNTFAIMRRAINKDNEAYMQGAYDAYKKNNPQFRALKSTLKFGGNRTLFTPIEEEAPKGNFFNMVEAEQNNVIYHDLNTGQAISQKKVFEETFLLKDSLRNIKWKITDETREIAGYTCRRANAVVMDSVYVVAFYTDKIPVSGGPESFSGLPGMILGVALPHENINWFASKVTEATIPETSMVPPKKGKAVDNKGFKTTMDSVLKEWGTYAHSYLKAFFL